MSPTAESVKSESGDSLVSSHWSTDEEDDGATVKKEEDDDDREATPKASSRKDKGKARAPVQEPLIGDAPKGKRRKVDS